MHKLTGVEISPRTSEWGFAFEHLVVCEVIRLNEYYQKDFSFSYFCTKDGFEIDLVIERPGQKDLFVEIKSNPAIQTAEFYLLEKFVTEVKGEGMALSMDPRSQKTKICGFTNGERV